MPESSPPPVRRPNPWRRWIVDPIRQQLTQGVSPDKIALTLAVGSALAVFPVLGTTTVLCLIAGVALGLNQPIMQGVNVLCFIIYFPLLIVFVRLGDHLTGTPFSHLDIPAMVALFRRAPGEFFRRFGVTGLHAVYGWAVVAPLWMLAVYGLTRPAIRAVACSYKAETRR